MAKNEVTTSSRNNSGLGLWALAFARATELSAPHLGYTSSTVSSGHSAFHRAAFAA